VAGRVFLGSRSPRRRELLSSIIPEDRVVVSVPDDPSEQGFDDCRTHAAIEARLDEVVSAKRAAVMQQLRNLPCDALDDSDAVVVADTIVVAVGNDGVPCVLGQPVADNWNITVRGWLRDYLSGRTHGVWTRYSVSFGAAGDSRTVRTAVELESLSEAMIDWYLSTGESLGKAGGYAIQGHASAFIKRFDGSLTNVIGLPLFELADAMVELGVPGIWQVDG
jgi:nucleoside triphosphate pyrophosphatase